jgi:hypothetical protein
VCDGAGHWPQGGEGVNRGFAEKFNL